MRLISVGLTAAFMLLATSACADNLETFVGQVPHPICGYNPDFDDRPSRQPTMPFRTCRSLAVGYSAAESYPNPGVDALSKLVIAMSETGGWEQRFGALNKPRLECRPPLSLGVPGVGSARSSVPVCTKAIVQDFMRKYEAQPVVRSFKTFETRLRLLDLSDSATVDKLRQGAAAIRVAGPSITFDEISELLK